MKYIKRLKNRKWIVIFVLFILVELIIEAAYTLSALSTIDRLFLQVTTGFAGLVTLLIMQRGMTNTQQELAKNRQRLQNIFETLDVAIWSHDMLSDTLLVTPGIEKLYGYSLEEFYKDKTLWKKMILPEDLHIIAERMQTLALGQPATSIYRIIRPDGEVRWIQDRGFPTYDESGIFVDFTSVLFDITDRKESEDRYRTLVEMSPDIIAVISKGKIDYINKAGWDLVGAANPEQLVGRPIQEFYPSHALEDMKILETTIMEDEDALRTFEIQVLRVDGNIIDVEMSAAPILYEGRVAQQVVGRDITQRKKAERTIQYMAYNDTLTELPNRYKFRQHLNKVLAHREHQMAAVLFLDLDRFKIINDTKGHTVGDLILQKVAKRLQQTVQHHGLVSRQGGDEFIISLQDTDKDKAAVIAQQLLDGFADPIDVNGQEYFVTPSIGISLYPADGSDEDTLIKNADTAMYLAKDRGKNNFQFYTPHLLGVSSRKMELENGLRKAMEQNEMTIYYQPQVELATGKLVGIEALIRWKHPSYGFVSPCEFIPLAEETGLILPLGKWVLRTACEQNKAWQDAGFPAVQMAVNISVRQMDDDLFVESVTEALNAAGLDPQYLELEITESIMQNITRSTSILKQLKELGVKLSIDDFGTGYSSLSYLTHLPIDKIKIDKSFIDDIIHHSNQGAMVKTIIDMGHNLNFTVIAEGIEKEEQVNFLIRNACTIGQGYFFSRPLEADNMGEFLRKGNILPILGDCPSMLLGKE
ncbi:sensor domain-containing protein [Cohnella kolymensis]|uniref:sensor domain-containing protein n=1 Tax=Cohnella kolymensis TaxID=1590652 RepID=UPI000696F75C|nr:bifunctional diguanylate cyclase/phosphodiesterase [Cohnella kolymensis]